MSSSVDIFILIIKQKLPRGWNELKIDKSLIKQEQRQKYRASVSYNYVLR